jgi:phospholipid/cholesterol/gamma-HCH transport system ATP-binding protein
MSEKKRTVIKVAGVSKSFGTRVVLDGIDLEVREGENVVILGLSGSGKSVLMKTIIGFLRPDRGRVEVLGRSWEERDESSIQELQRGLGVVF